MIASIVNGIAIIIGGILGFLIKSRLKEQYKVVVMQAMGLSVVYVGASGAIKALMDPAAESLLFIISLALGGLIGAVIGITARLDKLGRNIQERFATSDSNFAKSFIFASILFCVGTMSILGSIQSGMEGNHTILFTKSVIDGITALILASTNGIGVAFSSISVFLYEALLTLLAGLLGQYVTADMMREISIVGGILISCIGIDLLGIKSMRVADFLPAIFVPIVYFVIKGFFM